MTVVTAPPTQAVAMGHLAAEAALRRVRAAFDGRIVLLKGLEIAAYYPEPTDRDFGDVDLLTDEPERLQVSLLALGWSYLDDAHTDDEPAYRDSRFHHLAPLRSPDGAVVIEVHRDLGWLTAMTAPPLTELLARTVPSATGIEGVEALDPADHAVYLAVHSWRHRPFFRPQDPLEVAMVVEAHDVGAAAAERARAWGAARILRWYLTAAAARRHPVRLPVVVRALGGRTTEPALRTVRSDYLIRQVGRFFVDHPVRQARVIAAKVRRDLRPLPGETRRAKAARILGRLRTR